jgi:hypothetical protein
MAHGSVLSRMRNTSEKIVVDKIKTNILHPINFLFENLAIYAIM